MMDCLVVVSSELGDLAELGHGNPLEVVCLPAIKLAQTLADGVPLQASGGQTYLQLPKMLLETHPHPQGVAGRRES